MLEVQHRGQEAEAEVGDQRGNGQQGVGRKTPSDVREVGAGGLEKDARRCA